MPKDRVLKKNSRSCVWTVHGNMHH